MSTITGVHHLALTVADLDASVAWYSELFQMQVVMQEPHEGGGAIILREPTTGLFIGLHTHAASKSSTFDETVTGLDHISFSVSDRHALEQWVQRLADRGITFSPIVDKPYGSVVVFRDPDNIQLELIAAAARA